jgi:hypothetical protein
VIEQKSADQYAEIARSNSDSGAKTAIYIPELQALLRGRRRQGRHEGGVLHYEVVPKSK